jgi:hypothetical protein
MKLKDQVVSFGFARELKKEGVKENSEWVWSYNYTFERWELRVSSGIFFRESEKYESIATFTVAELGEMLPFNCHSYKDKFDGWQCEMPLESSESEIIGDTLWGQIARARQCCVSKEAKTEADARAKMLIYLIKERIIKVNK